MYVCMLSMLRCKNRVFLSRPDLTEHIFRRGACWHAVRVQAVRDAPPEPVGPLHDLRLGADSLDQHAEGRSEVTRGPHALHQVRV